MLTELKGKGGCLCQPAKQGQLRCPLIVRPTSEDVITGHVFQTLKNINPRHWLPQLLNVGLGAPRFRQQCFRNLQIELWANQPSYPPNLLPWKEGSTQVDAVITWENPPTTVFIEAKYRADLTPRSSKDDGQSGYPSDQLIRNLRVGLHHSGYLQEPRLFKSAPRDFALILFAPSGEHELVKKYRNPESALTAIPHSNCLHVLPRQPFVGQLTYADLCSILKSTSKWMTRVERMLVQDLIEYLEFKLATFANPVHVERQLDLTPPISDRATSWRDPVDSHLATDSTKLPLKYSAIATAHDTRSEASARGNPEHS